MGWLQLHCYLINPKIVFLMVDRVYGEARARVLFHHYDPRGHDHDHALRH
jgi:hypothetical protein